MPEIVYVVAVEDVAGVPDINPVTELNVRVPLLSAGAIEYSSGSVTKFKEYPTIACPTLTFSVDEDSENSGELLQDNTAEEDAAKAVKTAFGVPQ